MTKEIQGVVLTVLGIVVLRLAVGTAYLNYVKESLRPWLLVSGAVLVILGVLTFVDVVLRRSVPDEEPESDDGHGHGHRGPRVAWLIFLPVVAVFVVAPPALGAFSAARSPAVPSLLNTSLPDLPAGDPVTLYLSDYVQRAVWDKGTTLTGRTVELTGFVLPQPGGGWQLARMQITCCAADAFASKVQPVGLPAADADLPANQWVTIRGRWVPGGSDGPGDEIPLVQVESLQRVEQPENPYD